MLRKNPFQRISLSQIQQYLFNLSLPACNFVPFFTPQASPNILPVPPQDHFQQIQTFCNSQVMSNQSAYNPNAPNLLFHDQQNPPLFQNAPIPQSNSASPSSQQNVDSLSKEKLFKLAMNYRDGENGVQQDKTYAQQLLRKGADKSHIFSIVFYGISLVEGWGDIEDKKGGMEMFKIAADANDPLAMLLYANGLMEGWGGTTDRISSLAYFIKADERFREPGIPNPLDE
jgi:hypothetical protein